METQQQPSEDDIDRKAALNTGAMWADQEQEWTESDLFPLMHEKSLRGCFFRVVSLIVRYFDRDEK